MSMLTRLASAVVLLVLIGARGHAEPAAFPADTQRLATETEVSLRYTSGDAAIVAHLDGYPCRALGALARSGGGWRGTISCASEHESDGGHASVRVYLDGEQLTPTSADAGAGSTSLPESYVAPERTAWESVPWRPHPPAQGRWRIGQASGSQDPLLRRLAGLECSSMWAPQTIGDAIHAIELSCAMATVGLSAGRMGGVDVELVRPKGAHMAPSIAAGSALTILGHEGERAPAVRENGPRYRRPLEGSVLPEGTQCIAVAKLEGTHGWYSGGVRCGDTLALGIVAVGAVKPPRPVVPPAKNARFEKNGGEDFKVRVLAFGTIDAQRSDVASLVGQECMAPELTRTATGWYEGRLWCANGNLDVHEVAVEVVAPPKLVLISPSPLNPCGPPPRAVLKRHKLGAVKAPAPLATRHIVTRLEQYAHVPTDGAAMACSLVSDGKATWVLPDNTLLPARVLKN